MPELARADTKTENGPDQPIIQFAGQIFEPMPSGALFWRAQSTLLVADLHFEKMASFARRGQMLPPYDTALTLARLDDDLERTTAQKLIALGDSFHRDEAVLGLQSHDRVRLEQLMVRAAWTWISGNHDPAPHALGGACVSEISLAGITLCHEPHRAASPHIAGHLHPAARISINGRSTRAACFVADDNLMILPAYGSSTGSLNILGPAFSGLLRFDQLQVTMAGRDRVYPVSPARLIGG